MSAVIIRQPIDEAERDFAGDEERWFNEGDYPEDYHGSSSERRLIAEVDGVRCIITIEGPEAFEGGPARVKAIEDAILAAMKDQPHG